MCFWFLIMISFCLSAQSVLDPYQVSFPQTSKLSIVGNDVSLDGVITQLVSESTEYEMSYSVVSMPEDWSFYFCDPIYCHQSSTTSSTFIISGVGVNNIQGYFTTPSEGHGVVDLNIKKISTEEDTTIVLKAYTEGFNLGVPDDFVNSEIITHYNAKDKWYIKSKTEIYNWQLIDLKGRVLISGNSDEFINHREFPSGVYLLKITTNSGLHVVKLLK